MSSQRRRGPAQAGEPRHRPGQLPARVGAAWGQMVHEQRLAAGAAVGLCMTLFLPWYQETVVTEKVRFPVSASLTGWAAFSWVEAAVLLVAAGVLTLLFHRSEGHPFHLPGGDGFVIMAAGLWTCALVVWRIFDKQSTTVNGPGITTSGIEWGILVALSVAGLLAYAGSRLRAAHQPEPPLPGEAQASDSGAEITLARARARGSARASARAPAPEPEPEPEAVAARAAGAPRERPPGWLSARPHHLDEDPTVARQEQLTIPLDDRE